MTAATLPDPVRNWPLWWFARLEAALERGDRRTASEAVRRLDQLGIEVRFRLPMEMDGEVTRER